MQSLNIKICINMLQSFRDNCVSTYLREGDKLLLEISSTSFDGHDRDGPESHLYHLCLYFERHSKIYEKKFHREYWFHPDSDEYDVILPDCEISFEDYEAILTSCTKNKNKMTNVKIHGIYSSMSLNKISV
jgi:hypothetical protein